MTLRLRRVVLITMVSSCGPGTEPTLSISASPHTIDNQGGKTTLTVTALGADGRPGSGMVKVTSSAGSLTDPQMVSLLAGEADVDLTCAVAMDSACVNTVRAVGEWVVNGHDIGADTRVTIASANGGGAGGGSSGGPVLPDSATCAALGGQDALGLNGTATPLGALSATIVGDSSGMAQSEGVDLTWTLMGGSLMGTPQSVVSAGLVGFVKSSTPVTGTVYTGTNRGSEPSFFSSLAIQYNNASGVLTQQACPAGMGVGSIRFDDPGGAVLLGAYTFQCSAPAMSVSGCFAKQSHFH